MSTYIPHLQNYETELRDEFSSTIEKRTNPIIAIGGFSGTGKDIVALFIHVTPKVFGGRYVVGCVQKSIILLSRRTPFVNLT